MKVCIFRRQSSHSFARVLNKDMATRLINIGFWLSAIARLTNQFAEFLFLKKGDKYQTTELLPPESPLI